MPDGRQLTDACNRQGLKPGSAAHWRPACWTANTARRRAVAAAVACLRTEATEAGKSYYDVTNGVKFQRERYSCAQLGLMPNSGLFGQCVASLEGALLPRPELRTDPSSHVFA